MQRQQISETRTPLMALDCADRLGMLCSCACGLHCSFLPLLVAMIPGLPFFWSGVADADGVGWLTKLAAVASSVLVLHSIVPGFRVHRIRSVAWLAVAGITMVLMNAFLLSDHCDTQLNGRHLPLGLHSPTCVCQESCGVGSGMCLAAQPSGPPFLTPLIRDAEPPPGFAGRPTIQDWLAPAGAILLMLAHFTNLRLRKRTKKARSLLNPPGLPVLTPADCCSIPGVIQLASVSSLTGANQMSGITSTLTSNRC